MTQDYPKPKALRVGTFWQIITDYGDWQRSDPYEVVSVAPDGKSGEVQAVSRESLKPNTLYGKSPIKIGRTYVTIIKPSGPKKAAPWKPKQPNFHTHQGNLERAFCQNPAAALKYLDTIKADIERYMTEAENQAPLPRTQEESKP